MVKQVRSTEKGGVIIEQNAQCTLIAFDDPIYDFSTNIALMEALPVSMEGVTPNVDQGYAAIVNLLDVYAAAKITYHQRSAGSDVIGTVAGQTTDYGYYFQIAGARDQNRELANGSVQVFINGVEYISNTDQTDTTSPVDFHVTGTHIALHDIAHGGTLLLRDADDLNIYYELALV